MKYCLSLIVCAFALSSLAGCGGEACPPGTLRVANQCVANADPRCADPVGQFRDRDGDGFGTTDELRAGCPIEGFATEPGDCDDEDRLINPGAIEVCNLRDDDCNGAVDDDPQIIDWFVDADADGFGAPGPSVQSCDPVPGRAPNALDCDDDERQINPLSAEICDGRDEDCSGVPDDGPTMECVFGETIPCTTSCGSSGTATCSAVCEEGFCEPPEEICNRVDDDCDGLIDESVASPIPVNTVDYPALSVDDRLRHLHVLPTETGFALFSTFTKDDAISATLLELDADGRVFRGPSVLFVNLWNSSVDAIYTTPRIDAVADSDHYYVALPPAEEGPRIVKLSRSDLSTVDRAETTVVDTGVFTGQCLGLYDGTLAWARRKARFDLLGAPLPEQDLLATQIEVQFLDTDLNHEAYYFLEPPNNDGTRAGDCGMAPVPTEPGRFFVAFDADPRVETVLFDAEQGTVPGFARSLQTLNIGESRAFFVAPASDGSFVVGQGNIGWTVGRFQIGVGIEQVAQALNFGSLDGGLPGGGAVADGRLLLGGSRVDILEVDDLSPVEAFAAQGVTAVAEREGVPFLFSADPVEKTIQIEALGCAP